MRASQVSVDLPAVIARKNKVVQSGRQSLEDAVAARKSLRLYRGHARFRDAHTIHVSGDVNGEELTSEKIFINVGARHSVPPIEGLAAAGYLTNASIMELEAIPEHLLVLGGGYVGIEFAQMFARFGSQVTIVHSGKQILAHEDPEIAGELKKILEAEGLRFMMQAQTTRVDRSGGVTTLTLDTPQGSQKISGSHLLVATGRIPNTDDLGLAAAGIETDPRGFIRVNGRLETTAPGVWAMGDVKGGPVFTHISYNDYQIVWANLMEGKNLTHRKPLRPVCCVHRSAARRRGNDGERGPRQGFPAEDWGDSDDHRGAGHRTRRDRRNHEDRRRRVERPHSGRIDLVQRRRGNRATPRRRHDGRSALDAAEGRRLHPPDAGGRACGR